MAKKARKRSNGEGCITKKPNGYWEARIIVKNPLTGETELKTRCRKTQAEVKAWLDELKAQITFGQYTGEHKITVGEWVLTWLNEYVRNKVRTTTLENYEKITKNHILPTLGRIQLQSLTPAMIQQLYNSKLEAGRLGGGGLSAHSIDYIHVVLHGALKRALKNGIINRNVAELVDKPKKVKYEFKSLDIEQLKEFLIAIKGNKHYVAYLVECFTGIRKGELLALRWQDVNFVNQTITIRQSLVRTKEGLVFNPPKTEASRRTIPLNEEVLNALRVHKRDQNEKRLMVGGGYQDAGLVFCNSLGQPLEPRNFTRDFQKVLEQVGLPKIRFHDMRHTHATLLMSIGENMKVVQERLGHTTIKMTLDNYSHTLPGMQKSATDNFTKALGM